MMPTGWGGGAHSNVTLFELTHVQQPVIDFVMDCFKHNGSADPLL